MADNIYLLETRLSKPQQSALAAVREVARERGLTVFLVGGAVRDLIGGTAVRDLDVVVQGNALNTRAEIEKAGGATAGELVDGQAFFVRFPGGVRMEIGSTLAVTYPKPGKPVYEPSPILDDLRRRDFTANAMALSLNEGSYGLLMDPLNGVADIENRELRLVSNYGFIEDPVRMIRGARLMARLGWGMEEKTLARYETGKAEGYISAMDEFHRGYETEEIFHEEDPLRVMRRLEEEGWMQHLAPALSATKANLPELERLREAQAQLQTQGVVADAAAASFPLLTAKMSSKEVEALKKSFPRQGFVAEIEHAEEMGKSFAGLLGAKGAAQPSQAYKLIMSSDPEAVLWVAHSSKSAAIQAKFRSFYTEWPQARQRLPYVMLQEMRITPELPEYEALLDKLFYELMDGRLGTPEEMKAFLEPYSPPAPPPPVSLRRPRAPKKDAKPAKSRKKAVAETPTEGEDGMAEPTEAAAGESPTDASGPGSVDAGAAPAVAAAPPVDGAVPAKAAKKGEGPAKTVAAPAPVAVAPEKVAKKPVQQEPAPEVKGSKAGSQVSPKSDGGAKAPAVLAGKSASTKPAPAPSPAKVVAKGAAAKPEPKRPAPAAKGAPAKKAVAPGKGAAAKAPSKPPSKSKAPVVAAKKPTKAVAGKGGHGSAAKQAAAKHPAAKQPAAKQQAAKAPAKKVVAKPAAKKAPAKGSSGGGKAAAKKGR